MLPPENADDGSSHRHRQTIGYLGGALPVMVLVIDRLRPTDGLQPDHLSSISAFYYTGGVAVFTGILAALAVYLFTYQGYRNDHQRHDRIAAIVAGLAAVVVACFPTAPPITALRPSWWADWVGEFHYAGAVILFAAFAYFSLFLFPRSPSGAAIDAGKRCRNSVYYFCGGGMLACMTWAVIAGLYDRPVFWPETIALVLFACSWLTKGRADRVYAGLLMRGARALSLAR